MTIRLNKVTRDLNVGIATVVEFLQKKGYTVEANPNTKISEEQYAILVKEFSTDKNLRLESERFIQERQNKDRNKASVSIEGFEKQQEKPKSEDVIKTVVPEDARPKFKPVGKIDLDKLNGRKTDKVEKEPEQKKETVVERPVVERPIVAERPVVEPEVKKEPEKKEPEVKKEEVVAPAPTPAEPVVVKQPEPVAEPKPAEVEKVVEVVKKEESSAESSSDSSTDSVIPGKVFDGQYYVAYQVLRDKINSRFYWDANERVLLYTLPDGNVSVSENSSEYTAVNETKSEDYVILKTDGDIAYIALPFIQEYTNMEYSVEQEPNRAIITSKWGEIETAEVKKDTQVRYCLLYTSPSPRDS